MKTDFLVIGGGIAGLSAANYLAEKGADVTLLEAGTYPSHKICGEFLSPEALPILEKWEISIASTISKIKFILPKKEWTMSLLQQAGTFERYKFDEALAKRAEKKGAHICTESRVDQIIFPKNERENYQIKLVTGEFFSAPKLLISSGRLVNLLMGKKTPKFAYIGAKAHVFGKSDQLVMHLFQGAYFGIAPIDKDRLNIAGIIACTDEEAKDPKAVLAAFFSKNDTKILSESFSGQVNWLTGAVPEFGIQAIPNWPQSFFFGDAAGVIPPATGNGLAMGLTSGILAAEYALKNESDTFRMRWNQEYKKRIAKGIFLHRLFLSSWSQQILSIASCFPSLPHYFFRTTRGDR